MARDRGFPPAPDLRAFNPSADEYRFRLAHTFRAGISVWRPRLSRVAETSSVGADLHLKLFDLAHYFLSATFFPKESGNKDLF